MEDTDEWWEEVIDKCKEFTVEYENDAFARGLADAEEHLSLLIQKEERGNISVVTTTERGKLWKEQK